MTSPAGFDPDAPLPGPPDPWASTETPTSRSGPPYHMTDMIAAEPALAGRIVDRIHAAGSDRVLADAIRAALLAGEPVVTTGCGTSEHGALAVTEILREAAAGAGLPVGSIAASQAFESSLEPPSRGLVIGITHEGGTPATNAALSAARDAGARTAVITVSGRSPAGTLAEIVVETGELDQSWCHTVGYVSPMVAATAVGAALSDAPLDPRRLTSLLGAGLADERGTLSAAIQLAARDHLIVTASGADRPAGRELVLKVEEATWLPSAFRDLETFLHGHLPATGPSTGLVLILADRRGRPERLARSLQLLAAANVIGVASAAILAADLDAAVDPALTPAGRLLVDEAPDLPASVAALMGTATPLQALTERLARVRGTDPDPIRRDDLRYRTAAAAAGG